MNFSLIDLDKALRHKNIKVEKTKSETCDAYWLGGSKKQIRKFTINGQSYKINWYANTCYLEHNNVLVQFRKVVQKNTWPTNSKMNLQFYNDCNKICCIISIEKRNE